MNSRYEVIPFSEHNFHGSLTHNKFCRQSEVEKNNFAKYLLKYLKGLGAVTIIIENKYIDGDYLEDYASYYVRCFKEYDRNCKRIHFFSTRFDKRFFEGVVCRVSSYHNREDLTTSYLGFVVARPLPGAIIGKTVLATYPSDNGRRNYTKRPYQVNLFGINLRIDSLALQEQDTVVGACATVALWVAFHKTADLFGTLTPTPAKITKAANSSGTSQTRATPVRDGLSVDQIAHAIRSNDLEPELLPITPKIPLVPLVYSYLRLGLPILLGVEILGIDEPNHHVVTISGYSIDVNKPLSYEDHDEDRTSPDISFSGLRINKLYAHDDQIGPFSRLKIISTKDKERPVLFYEKERNLILAPEFLLAPVYNKIRITFLDVMPWIVRLWNVWKYFIRPDEYKSWIWDAYLSKSNDLKFQLATELRDHPGQIKFLTRNHPRFIWRISLYYQYKIVFDLFGDATDVQHSPSFYHSLWYDSDVKAKFCDIFCGEKRETVKNFVGERFFEFLQSEAKDGECL